MPRSLLLFVAVLLGITRGDSATLEIPEQTLYIGDTVLLKCLNAPSILYKNNLQLQGTTTQHDAFYLDIIGSFSSDDVYVCGNQEEQSAPKKLKITERNRKIQLTASPETLSEHGQVTLTCDIEDYEGQYVWTKHGTKPDEIRKYSNKVTVAEGGTYSCLGVNRQLWTQSSNTVVIMKCNSSSDQTLYIVAGVLSAVLFLIVLYVIKDRCFGRTPATDVMTKDDESQPYVNMSAVLGQQ